MSFRPRFSNPNNAFPSFNANNNSENSDALSQSSTDTFQNNIRNKFPNTQYINSSHMNRYPLPTSSSFGASMIMNERSQLYNNASFPRPPINVPPLSQPNLINSRSHNLVNFSSQPANVNLTFHPLHDLSCIRNPVPPIIANSNNPNFNFNPRNLPIQRLRPPTPNVACSSLPPNINFPRFQNNTCFNSSKDTPVSLHSLSQLPLSVSQNTPNVLNSPTNYTLGTVNNSVSQAVIYTSPLTVRPSLVNLSQDSSAKLQNNSVQMPLQLLQNDASESKNLNSHLDSRLHDKEIKIAEFLAKFSFKKNKNKHQVTIPEFRYLIKAAIRMVKLLQEKKNKLSMMLDASESDWKSEAENILNEQEELSTLCSFISAPDHLNNVIEKLKLIKKRRERKKKTKQNKLAAKMRAEQKRKEHHQEIDKWLDDIKEKNQKIKREAELKKEADYILLEVRRKIYEAKKTIEKIKVFEKLRNVRQANATKKGLHVLSMHNTKFEKKMSILKETMIKQLSDYEAEEKALKVMLETEQEGQREEEVKWKIKKMKTLQQKKQNHIMECLFGISDDPEPTDPLYLFHKYHTSGTSSIENLVQIRNQWDIHLAESGEVIPQQWVVPVAPSNTSWEQCLITSKN